MNRTVIGMDIAKDVFQLHSVDVRTGEIERHKLRRAQVMEFFVNRAPAQVAIEACGGAHWWARQLRGLGHEVKLIAPRSVRPFVLRNKTDAANARAIWTAVQQPEARLVAIKSEAQQGILALHRVRAQLMKFRIMQTNGLRGLLYEFGEVLPAGQTALTKAIPDALARVAERLPGMLIDTLREQWARAKAIDIDMPRASDQGASLPLAWGWCHDKPAPVGVLASWASVSAATRTCERCSCTGRARSSLEGASDRPGSRGCLRADPTASWSPPLPTSSLERSGRCSPTTKRMTVARLAP